MRYSMRLRRLEIVMSVVSKHSTKVKRDRSTRTARWTSWINFRSIQDPRQLCRDVAAKSRTSEARRSDDRMVWRNPGYRIAMVTCA